MLEMRQSAMMSQSQMPVQQSLRHEIAVGSNDVFIKPRESATDATDLVNHMNKQRVDANSMAINTESVRMTTNSSQAGVRMEDSASQMKPMMMDSMSNTA
jgi:hypothetical protein